MDLQHIKPAWGHKADFIVGAEISDPTYSKEYTHEQLWAKELGDGLYEICCIPFALYDLFLGDVVNVNEGLELLGVVRRSGHLGFRVATKSGKEQEEIVDELHSMGHLTERFSDKLLAVDADDVSSAQEIADTLEEAERSGRIMEYETLKTKK